MVGFGSMMIAAHRGLYSLGLVLTIGVGTCLLVSVITVPAILTWMTRHRGALTVELLSAAESPSRFEDAPQTLEFLRIAQFPDDDSPDEDQGARAA
jgi:predicted RND superfamily exporter protein